MLRGEGKDPEKLLLPYFSCGALGGFLSMGRPCMDMGWSQQGKKVELSQCAE